MGEIPLESNPNIDLIKQLNHRTVKLVESPRLTFDIFLSFFSIRLVRLAVESALANVEFDTLKSQLQLCTQLKKYFDSIPIDDLK